MKRYIILVSLVMLSLSAFAVQQEITPISTDVVNVRIETRDGQVDEQYISQTVAMLAEDINVVIHDMQIATYDSAGNRLSVRSGIDFERVRVSDSFVMREMFGFSVTVEMKRDEDGMRSVVESLDYDIVGVGHRDKPVKISKSYYELYKALADNFETSYLRDIQFQKPAMLIINHDNAQFQLAIRPYVNWKKMRGYDVTVVNRTDIAANPTSTQIRDFVRDYYLSAENKPEYLVLIGDTRSNQFPMPTFYTGVNNDATDLPYALIEGDDYFPEIMIGRISVSNALELMTIVNKSIAYERNPYTEESEWLESALIVAGNYATSHPIPITPVLMSRWLHDLYRESGYTSVDTVFWWVGDGNYGTSQIIESLNRGAQFVSYRGWGDANGWHYPEFRTRHLQQNIQSGRKTPVVTSIVCNTGDFANTTVSAGACFGEVWMRMGSVTSPNGAVAFVGPTDLYTSTEFNNTISSGMHWGIHRENIRSFAAAVLRGKIELYRGYPNNRDAGDMVDFYFRVYNVLSDPALRVWVLHPQEMNVSLPSVINQGTNFIEFSAPGLNGGHITVTRDDENYELFRIENDYGFIELNPEDQRDVKVVVTRENFKPYEQVVEVVSSNNVGLSDYEFSGEMLSPGSENTINLTLKNFGDDVIENVIASISSNAPEFISFVSSDVSFGAIGANETSTAAVTLSVAPECPRNKVIQFNLAIAPTNDLAKFEVLTGGIHFEVLEHYVLSPNNVLDPGETSTIELTLVNKGEYGVYNLTAHIEPLTDAVAILSDNVSFGDIPVGGSASSSFSVSAQSDAFVGREIYFELNLTDQVGMHTTAYFNITLGEVDHTAPTGPDAYGYYAFDSYDSDYAQAPVFDWIDIDPENGGNGEDFWLEDDESIVMDLPFTFRYYGYDYDELVICSNGWISFIPTWESNFRNWPIPSAINPKGIIAPMWDDLKGKNAVNNRVRIAHYHDQANNRMIISWLDTYNVADLSDDGLEKIQLILEPREDVDGDIVFQYHTIWNRNSTRNFSTTGIMNHRNTVGLQYGYANNYAPSATPLRNGLAIRFTTDAPDSYVSVDPDIVPSLSVNLKQNYPNPFNPETTIEFDLPARRPVKLEVYNILGQKIKTLINRELEFGNHRVVWNGKDDSGKEVGSGVYLYKLETPEETRVNRMILLK